MDRRDEPSGEGPRDDGVAELLREHAREAVDGLVVPRATMHQEEADLLASRPRARVLSGDVMLQADIPLEAQRRDAHDRSCTSSGSFGIASTALDAAITSSRGINAGLARPWPSNGLKWSSVCSRVFCRRIDK